ncbi:hypothetical protein CBOM_01989 [Ceraceosorus bombacis]|uniref:Uncharacterized protein n=1 Tax=Ceraceosorus bombacis TaxID=401625 RepID=A0A0P1BEP8_9BASI|nr:hypothetical protein CBOM_01989 [Ceraceosorus bombacis]
MLLQPPEIKTKRAKGELEGKVDDDNVEKKERRRVKSNGIEVGKVMIGSDASSVLECSETSEALSTARPRKKAKRSTKQAFDTELLDKTQQEQHRQLERHLERHDVSQVHEAAIEWMHQAPEAWAINVDTFALAVPIFPPKAHTFISQGGYARGLRLGFHRDLTVLHAWSVDEQSIVLQYRFPPPSARQACWSDKAPVKQKLQGLARPLALIQSYEQGSQVCLFLQKIKSASSASSSQLSLPTSDGEKFLQTLLPDGVDVVLLGRFSITGCHLVEQQTQGEAWHLRLTFKWSKSQGEPWFHASMTPREHNASLEGKDSNWTRSASDQRFDRCSLYPPFGTWLDRADDLLQRLIARDMPYERGSSSSRQTANLYVSRICGVKADCQQSPQQGLYTSKLLDLQRAPEVFLDVAQYADDATRRFAERPRNAINDATVCVGVKMDLQPLDHADLHGWLQLVHFGSDAHITLSRKPDVLSTQTSSTSNPAQRARGASSPRPRSRVIATWQLDHGDVLFVQDCKSLGQEYELRFHGKVGLSILALCRYLAPSP